MRKGETTEQAVKRLVKQCGKAVDKLIAFLLMVDMTQKELEEVAMAFKKMQEGGEK